MVWRSARQRVLLLFWCLLLSIPVSVKAQLDVSVEDSLALVALYNATGGPNWTNKTNWLTGRVHSWHGVGRAAGRVEYLQLSNNNLQGALPDEIGDLTALRVLNLSVNNLRGSIPPELGNLTELAYLDLGVNDLTGTIPAELGNLHLLEVLTLRRNSLRGPLPPLYNLTRLERIEMSDNRLEGPLPDWLGDLPALLYIRLRENEFSGPIPASLGNAPKLKDFSLGNNQLSGSIPESLGNLSTLTHLSLGGNQLSGTLPAEIGNLTNLISIQLQFNFLEGSIPPSWGNLSQLTVLYLFDNNMSGVLPPEIGGMTALEIIVLDNNQFSGSLPPEIGNLVNLGDLRLRNNQFTGPLPSSLSNLKQLNALYIEDNTFEGALPVGSLTNLSDIRFANNRIDDLPDLSGIDDLYTIIVRNNRLTFEDIEPNIGLARNGIFYTPQARVGSAAEHTLQGGEALTLHIPVGGANNIYQWYRDGMLLVGATTDTYTIPAATAADAGTYLLVITNSVATQLTLESHAIQVTVITYPPETQADAATTPEDTPLDVDVLGNDFDPDGTALSVADVSDPQFGTASIHTGGTVSYSPNANFYGTDTFVYTAIDGEGKTAPGTVTITVTPVNDAPYFTSEPEEIAAEGQVYTYSVTTTDVDADVLTLDAMTLPAWLTLTDNNNTSALLTGTPMQADVGTHEVVLTVTDGTESVEQAFVLTVTDVNTPPSPATLTALTDGSSMTLEGDPEAAFVVTWTAASDPDGDPLTYRWELATANTFDPLLFSEDVDTATQFETTVGTIGALLKQEGVEINTSITLFHRVVVSDGIDETASDPAQITLTRGIITDTESSAGLPEQFVLLGNYPNPFNPETTIRVDVPEAAQVTVVLYDVLGREARRIEAGALAAGTGQAIRITAGGLSSGVYVYRVIGRLASGEVKTATGRMTLLK